MSTNKNWINLLRNSDSNEYYNGAMAFVEQTKNFMNNRGVMRYLCKKCCNEILQTIETLKAHIMYHDLITFL